MKVTNKMNLPKAFVNAVSLERHNSEGHYSATTLNKGAKEIVLTARHFDDIEVDAADSIWAVWGTAVHALFESVPDDNFHEERFCVPVSNSKVTGQVDSYDLENEMIFDWKTASVWKVQMRDFEDWHKQGMTYAWLLKQSGLNVKRCVFVALLKDHSKSKAAHDSEYPQSPVYTYQFDINPAELEKHGEWISGKVAEIERAMRLEDDAIEPCSKDERWADDDKWAVMKNGRKTAVRVFDNEMDAEACAGELGNSHYVEHRPATSRKCEGYCSVRQWCSFYKQTHGGNQ